VSESRTVDELTLAATTTTADVEEWLRRYGVDRVVVIDDQRVGFVAVLWQETFYEQPQMAVPGDVLRAVDLGGTTGKATVINGGTKEWRW
jgi:hypothetical protein